MELVVAAAVEIADESGLAAVTMAAVAKRCGFTTMSLYRHVASKDELVRRMLDETLGTAPALESADWRAGLEQWSRAMLAVLECTRGASTCRSPASSARTPSSPGSTAP